MKHYFPKKSNWNKAMKLAQRIKILIGAKEIINMRIARGGCFVARYYLGLKRVKGIECDSMCEIKIYDNIPYMEKK